MTWVDWIPTVSVLAANGVWVKVWRSHTRRMDAHSKHLNAVSDHLRIHGEMIARVAAKGHVTTATLQSMVAQYPGQKDAPGGSRGVRNIEPEGADPS